MAGLPDNNYFELIKYFPMQFALSANISNFEPKNFYQRFEARAEELEKTHPGEGYQLAHNETLINLFGGIVTKHINGDPQEEIPTLNNLLTAYQQMMEPYFQVRKEIGMSVDIVLGANAYDEEMAEVFNSIMLHIPQEPVMKTITDKFEKKELTLDSVTEYVESIKDSTPDRIEARELVAMANYIESVNNSRSKIWTFFRLPPTRQELSTIEALRTLAAKTAPIEQLNSEATTETFKLRLLRAELLEEIRDSATVQQIRTGSPILTENIVKDINEGIIDKKDEIDGDLMEELPEQGKIEVFDNIDGQIDNLNLNESIIEGDNLIDNDDNEELSASLNELLNSHFGDEVEPFKEIENKEEKLLDINK